MARTKLKAAVLCSVRPGAENPHADESVKAERQGAGRPCTHAHNRHYEGWLRVGGHRKANLKTNQHRPWCLRKSLQPLSGGHTEAGLWVS